MRRKLTILIAPIVALCVSACGSDDGGSQAPIAVLSAFPAELAAVLEHVDVESTVVIAERNFRVGTLGGEPVVVGMTGVGLVNAANVTRALLAQIEVSGVVVSGVAGSALRIGDVAVPADWKLADGSTFPADPSWLKTAGKVAGIDTLSFEKCTRRPAAPNGDPVCLPHDPQIVVGGIGESDDPFSGTAVACQPNGGDVFGCDVVPVTSTSLAATRGGGAGGPEVTVASVDMESAAIAREAAVAGVRFIAFRAVSDGEGDPLGLPGFPAQFFTYYRLAAHNAAEAAAAFVVEAGR